MAPQVVKKEKKKKKKEKAKAAVDSTEEPGTGVCAGGPRTWVPERGRHCPLPSREDGMGPGFLELAQLGFCA